MTHRLLMVLSFMGVAALATFGFVFQASAETAPEPPSEQKLQSIQLHCTSIKASLNQLHTTDALLRVNRGQTYTSMSTNLMAKLNSRVALNRLDGSELVRVTTQYEDDYEAFRVAYQEYSDAMADLEDYDCIKDPRGFYEMLTTTRQKRAAVNAVVKRLNGDILAYQSAFATFRKNFMANQTDKKEKSTNE